ncbi:2496_t:CDS:1 [Acaulospora morrowiae]|uniref:2496_t:CDS:1 n=1 Tax=Acaulospora morrowiae TaxID=94023 RepID=A0A9N9F3D5_9GLOM|nr:2496_t:CDS:1 [Acaulospora morrowiae]
MASGLPSDILTEIFENLEDENVTLFSCLLVKRSWCEAIVPILWRNPLKDVYEKNKNELPIMVQCGYNQILCIKKNLIYLLRTLLLCLSNESKDLLSKSGYELSNDVLRRPRYDYASYCRYISTADISMLIWNGMNQKYACDPFFNYMMFLVTQEIYKLFLEKSTKIFQLSLMSGDHSLYYFPGAKSSLASLTVFKCNSYVSSTILYGLAQFCHNIEDIAVEFCDKDHDGVNSLIRVQKGLKYFQCRVINNSEEQRCQLLGVALKTQARSLLKLDLGRHSCIPLKIITDFTSLRYLRFGLSSEISENTTEYLKRARIPNLETLIVDGDPVRSDILEPLIISTNRNLRKLHMSGWCPDGLDNPGFLLPVLSEHCPKLKFLTIWIDDDDFEELEILLDKCRELEGLYLRCSNMHSDEPGLFNILKSAEIPYLNKLKLEDCWLVEKGDAFEDFLRVRKKGNAKPISLEVVGYLNSDMYLDILSLYRWYGVLKDTKVLVYGEDSAPDEIVPSWRIAARI